jgi:periplasmic divalent cation tolerance protein
MDAVDTGVVMVLTTAPDAATADRIAAALVERRLAACVNVVPGIRSTYRWKGTVERADESLLLIKTTRAGVVALKAEIAGIHPYEVPEVVVIPAVEGADAYLRWVVENVGDPGGIP